MSQFFIGVTAGDIPPVVAEQYTTNSGVAVPAANNLNVFGQTSFTSPVMYTTGSGSTIEIENRAYIARYVVDSNTSVGVRGTYSDVQSAVNALQADGVSGVIYIRPGIYSGAVTIPNGMLVNFVGLNLASFSVNGQWTISSGAVVYINSIQFKAQSGQSSLVIGSANAIVTDCEFTGTDGTSSSISITGDSDNLTFDHCFFNAKVLIAGSAVNSGAVFLGCEFSQNIAMSGTGVCALENCRCSTVTLAGSAFVIANCCIFFGGGAGTGTISGTSSSTSNSFYYNVFFGAGATAFTATTTLTLVGNVCPRAVGGLSNLFNGNPTVTYNAAQSGNISQIANASGTYLTSLSDSVVLVNTSGSAATISMYANPFAGLTYTVADISGNASINHITVAGNGSNIDGAPTFVISANYGSITLIYTGTIWKVI